MCFAFAEQGVLFTGDHVMGWSTTVVSPPDGDMAAYIESLRKVAGRAATARTGRRTARRSTQPQRYVDALVEHRLERERQVLDAVRGGLDEIPAIVAAALRRRRREAAQAGRPVACSPTSSSSSTRARSRVADGGRPRLTSRFEAT